MFLKKSAIDLDDINDLLAGMTDRLAMLRAELDEENPNLGSVRFSIEMLERQIVAIRSQNRVSASS